MRHLSFCLALLLSLARGLAFAEGVVGPAAIPPIRSPGMGLVSLFRSPVQPQPPRTEPPQPGEPPLTIVPAREVAQRQGLQISAGAMCRAALIAAEAKYGIPAGLLQAIGV